MDRDEQEEVLGERKQALGQEDEERRRRAKVVRQQKKDHRPIATVLRQLATVL
jgi:hypothetical protein